MNWLEFIDSIIESLAWPTVAAIAVAVFAPMVKTLAPRLHKVGPQGMELFPQSSQSESAPLNDAIDFSSIELDPLEDKVAAETEKKNLESLEAYSDDKKPAVLLRALTAQQMHKNFAIAYANIYGGQLRALDILNGRPIALEEARRLFDEAKESDPFLKDSSIEEYMKYLMLWKFVELDKGNYSITETGRNFLTFLAANGLSKERVH